MRNEANCFLFGVVRLRGLRARGWGKAGHGFPSAPEEKGRAEGKRKVLGRPPAEDPLEPGDGLNSWRPVWTSRCFKSCISMKQFDGCLKRLVRGTEKTWNMRFDIARFPSRHYLYPWLRKIRENKKSSKEAFRPITIFHWRKGLIALKEEKSKK